MLYWVQGEGFFRPEQEGTSHMNSHRSRAEIKAGTGAPRKLGLFCQTGFRPTPTVLSQSIPTITPGRRRPAFTINSASPRKLSSFCKSDFPAVAAVALRPCRRPASPIRSASSGENGFVFSNRLFARWGRMVSRPDLPSVIYLAGKEGGARERGHPISIETGTLRVASVSLAGDVRV